MRETTYIEGNNKITIHQDNKPIYDIHIESNFDHLFMELDKLQTSKKKICIVSDSNVSTHYLSQLVEILKDYAMVVETFTFPAGEEHKTLATVEDLYAYLIESKFDRGDMLVALGGGVVGDLTGYTAATYLRGIWFMQIPTSLLSMVDSSIGGKTGVDFRAYKNMVGAFHMPKSVYINLSCLNTMNERDYRSGFGEVVKYGIMKDKAFYEWLRDHATLLVNRDIESLNYAVTQCCLSKQRVVEVDPTEKGERALLNLGHTIGHAIEKMKHFTLLHGECVSIGMVAAGYLSYQRNLLSKEDLDDMIETLRLYKLPVRVSGIQAMDVLQATKNDKKMASGKIKFILLHDIGNALIDDTVTDEEMLSAIKFVIE